MQLEEHFGVLLHIPLHNAECVSADAVFTVQRGEEEEVIFTARILYSPAACDIQIKYVGKQRQNTLCLP